MANFEIPVAALSPVLALPMTAQMLMSNFMRFVSQEHAAIFSHTANDDADFEAMLLMEALLLAICFWFGCRYQRASGR